MIHHVDPITVEIIHHALISITDQVELNITRTAYSPLIHTYKDYAVALVDVEGRLIVQAQGSIPIFVANALGVAVRDGIACYGLENIHEGDLIFTNHAATMGQHLNNVAMYSPVCADRGGKKEIVAFMGVLVHWIDIGGAVLGSSSGIGRNITEIFQEGIQYRSIKLWSSGHRCDEIYRIIENNSRFPRMLLGDIEAQVSGCLSGRDMFLALIAKYGLGAVETSIKAIWGKSEARVRDAIRAIPDGTYSASSFLDDDGEDRGEPVPITVTLIIADDEMTIDFTGTSPQVRGAINSGREGGAVVAARVASKYLLAPDEPANEGAFKPISVIIPDGTLMNAIGDAAMGGYSMVLPTAIDTVIRAMSVALPDIGIGGHQANLGNHSVQGIDPRTGDRFRCIMTSHGGWGASSTCDGPGPYKTLMHGDTMDIPVEMQEALYPVRIDENLLACDSGGPGEYRGGLGLDRLITALSDSEIVIAFDRHDCPPWGVLGGGEGRPPKVYIHRGVQHPELLLKGQASLRAGDQVRVCTPGGGGYGDPKNRRPERIAHDLAMGYISGEAAQRIYDRSPHDRS